MCACAFTIEEAWARPPRNCRPVSNLQYISKLTKKAVFERIHNHMINHSLYIYPEVQSSYRQDHSTEMALVIVMKDTLMKINTQEATLLVILDLSVAFDTVNYNILLTCLDKEFGICRVTLEWFKSYLANNRGQRVSINGSLRSA